MFSLLLSPLLLARVRPAYLLPDYRLVGLQGTRTGQPRFTDIAKDTGSWGFNKLHQGVKLTKGLASDKPGTKPATGSSAGAGAGTTGQGYRP